MAGFFGILNHFGYGRFLVVLASLFLLLADRSAHAADRAFDAFEATPIFGDNREVVKVGRRFVYCFPYRNGTVTYRPRSGASYASSPHSETVASVGTGPELRSSPAAAHLPNSCLVFACAKAE